jgi:hypothetical protein
MPVPGHSPPTFDAPEAVRAANRWVQFNVTRITDASETNVLEMSGAERTVTATIHGDFHLHRHTTQKSARVELVFRFDGDEPEAMAVRTTAPIDVGLAEHDVRPRSAFGTLAQATLGTLRQKVAEAAPITLELSATAGAPLVEVPPCALETVLRRFRSATSRSIQPQLQATGARSPRIGRRRRSVRAGSGCR